MDFRSIRRETGLSQKKFSEKYNIPRRTIEDWEGNRRTPPEYVLSLLERSIVDKNKITRALKVLTDNGVEEDEAEVVLQAIGYTLLNTELF